jgi:hypothetical protein
MFSSVGGEGAGYADGLPILEFWPIVDDDEEIRVSQ